MEEEEEIKKGWWDIELSDIARLKAEFCNGGIASGVKALRTRWQKPPVQFVKVNVDAAYQHTECLASFGVVIRNSEGGAHGVSLWQEIAIEEGFDRVVMESNYLLALTKIRKKGDFLRESNMLADSVAKAEVFLGHKVIWRNALPPNICNGDL
ncbi:hypothetical protein PTKIN_Ptkin14bG0042900 [Pterospermum kingtungense]